MINSFVQTGLLKDVDLDTFKQVTRFNTVHQNFLQTIEEYNQFYDKYITSDYDKGMDHFYEADTNRLRPKYVYLEDAAAGIADFASMLVNIADELADDIKIKHLDWFSRGKLNVEATISVTSRDKLLINNFQ